MRLSKTQIKIVNELQNGGYIWEAGGFPYLAIKDNEGRIKSSPVHGKAFSALVKYGVICQTENKRWKLCEVTNESADNKQP
jgi:hypothetical protein